MVSIQKWCLFEAMVQRLGIVVHEIMASYTQHTARPLSLRWFGRLHVLFDHVWSKPKLLHPETAIFLKIKLYFRELHV